MKPSPRAIFVARAAIVGVMSLALPTGCRVYEESLVHNTRACGTKRIPDRPTRDPAAATEETAADATRATFVLRATTFRQSEGVWEQIAYDLDGYCTQAPDLDSGCTSPSAVVPLDGADGVDNSTGQNILPLFFAGIPTGEDGFVASMSRGMGGVWVQVEQWSGLPDDDQVRVALAQTVYATPQGQDAAEPPTVSPNDPTWPLPRPQWNGSDEFRLNSRWFSGGDITQPLAIEDQAYVRDGAVVARIPDGTRFVFAGTGRSFEFSLTGAVLVLRMNADGSSVQDAVITGRWPVAQLTSDVESLGVCDVQTSNEPLWAAIRDNPDLTATPSGQAANPGAPLPSAPLPECDAFSFAIQLQGSPAHASKTAPPYTVPHPCP
jgi:hypothetical protein